MSDDDPFESQWFRDFSARVTAELIPDIRGSAITISIAPGIGDVDVKYATELGFMILFDKPVIIVADREDKINEHMRRVADEIVIGDLGTQAGQDAFKAAIDRVNATLDAKEDT